MTVNKRRGVPLSSMGPRKNNVMAGTLPKLVEWD